jgi:hypothetical protein
MGAFIHAFGFHKPFNAFNCLSPFSTSKGQDRAMRGLRLGVVVLESVSLVLLDPKQRVRIKRPGVFYGYLDSALSILSWLSDSAVALLCVQVIQATVEKHKQKSETFRAFGGACSQDEEPTLSPDQPVSQKGEVGFSCWPGREA